jgi:DnaJ-class molecular chaperone
MYKILGLSEGASTEEVKKAYKKLVLIHHPDKGGDPNEFRKITEAYEQIINPPVPQQQQQQHVQVVNLSLAEVILGCPKVIKITRIISCNSCKSCCTMCNGSGRIIQQVLMFTMQHVCPSCNGSGSLSSGCGTCNFKKCTEIHELMNVNVLPGTQEHNIQHGTIILVIKIDSHPDFVRIGPTQVLWCPKISFDDSVKGTIIKCPFFTGEFDVDTTQWGILDPRIEYQSSVTHVKIKFDIQYPPLSNNIINYV